jgi:hypothetical protein
MSITVDNFNEPRLTMLTIKYEGRPYIVSLYEHQEFF